MPRSPGPSSSKPRSRPVHELILGGQRSGKSRCAEQRASAWLAGGDGPVAREAVLIATATAGDAEMRDRIARHRLDRAQRVPRLATVEEPLAIAQAIATHSEPHRLVVVDCLTLWLTNLLMPLHVEPPPDADTSAFEDGLALVISEARGPVVLVSNEIGLGVAPMSSEARRFVDRLGRLHQWMAKVCDRVTLMVAGLEVPVKREAPK